MNSCEHHQLLTTLPVMHQRMAFYAGVYVPKVGFTLSPGEVSEWKALIQKGIDYEQKRIEKGGLPKALTLEYLREIADHPGLLIHSFSAAATPAALSRQPG